MTENQRTFYEGFLQGALHIANPSTPTSFYGAMEANYRIYYNYTMGNPPDTPLYKEEKQND